MFSVIRHPFYTLILAFRFLLFSIVMFISVFRVIVFYTTVFVFFTGLYDFFFPVFYLIPLRLSHLHDFSSF